MLHEHLSATPVCTHRVWQREVFKHLQDLLAQHMEQSALMHKILECSLTRLKVYQTSRPQASGTTDTSSLIPILEKVEKWLGSIGLENEVGEWTTYFAQPILDDAHKHVDATYDSIKSAICSTAVLNADAVNRMTAPLNDKALKGFITRLF